MQVPIGSTLVPVLFESGATHLTNFSGHSKVCPLSIRIGNMKSSTRHKSSDQARVPVFFFFFFYSQITPHSPAGMAGEPERTRNSRG